MFLIHPDDQDILSGLETWDWIDFSDKKPIAVTAFGDVFFESEQGIYFLDKIAGQLERVCNKREQLEEILNSPDGKDHYLMAELVLLAREREMVLAEGECYEFKIAPILSGTMDFENLQKMNFKLSLHINGQVIKQVKDLPPGAQITEVKLADS